MMKNSIPCSVVRDLLPSYVEGLTDAETAELVKAHLQTCEACRSLYRDMTGEVPVLAEDKAEVDYLKKVRRSKRRLVIAAVCLAVLLAGAGVFLAMRSRQLRKAEAQIQQSAVPEWSYDEETKTLVIYGTDDYTRMELPDAVNKAVNLEVQDNNFHMAVFVPVLKNKVAPLQTYLPGFIDRTDKSFAFLRAYLREHAGGAFSEENAAKFVQLNIRRSGDYEYSIDQDRLVLEVGDYFWHRDTLYVMALMDFRNVEWQQLGYTFYLGTCVNPYTEEAAYPTDADALRKRPYFDAYLAFGGGTEGAVDQLATNHASAWYGLEHGFGRWGSAAECTPVSEFYWYTGPQKAVAGNDMSLVMATSFIGWLADKYSFEAVTGFCAGTLTFREAFGTDFQTARAAWETWLRETVERAAK